MSDIYSDFVVFDLDDTLYKEVDYLFSGYAAVSDFCQSIYKKNVIDMLLKWRSQGESDVFLRLCFYLSLPESCKSSFVWVYRNHSPKISLAGSTSEAILAMKELGFGIAIVTDGRSSTQRLKLDALNLLDFPVLISEEWGEVKPGLSRFCYIQDNFAAERYWYIGDNPQKDFYGPNRLGWFTVGLKDDGKNIHSQDCLNLIKDFLPRFWIDDLSDLIDVMNLV